MARRSTPIRSLFAKAADVPSLGLKPDKDHVALGLETSDCPVNPFEVHTPRLVSVEHAHLVEAMLFGAETGDAPLGPRA